MPVAENTLVIIKPDYLDKRITMLQLLLLNGFRMTHRKMVSFTPEQAAEFYKDLEKHDPCFAIKVMSLSKGPSQAVILNKVNAIRDLLTIMTSPSCCHYFNSGLEYKIHASVSGENAKNEIRYIFPNVIYEEPSRKVPFGSICGRKKLTGLISDGIFDACEGQVKDNRGFMSKYLLEHSYECESGSACDQ